MTGIHSLKCSKNLSQIALHPSGELVQRLDGEFPSATASVRVLRGLVTLKSPYLVMDFLFAGRAFELALMANALSG